MYITNKSSLISSKRLKIKTCYKIYITVQDSFYLKKYKISYLLKRSLAIVQQKKTILILCNVKYNNNLLCTMTLVLEKIR